VAESFLFVQPSRETSQGHLDRQVHLDRTSQLDLVEADVNPDGIVGGANHTLWRLGLITASGAG
jgi:hypothetical protein